MTLYSLYRCNQCKAPHAVYCRAVDEYLCEDCERYALETEFVREEMDK